MNTPDPHHPPKQSSEYDTFADKVGLVPNVRGKDNLYQGLACIACALIAVMVAYFMGFNSTNALILSAVGGLLVGVMVSGLILMIIGLARD